MADDLIAKLLRHRESTPDRIGLVFEPAFGRPRVELSYRQIADRAEAVARQLLHRVGPGQRALLLLPSVPEFVHAFLGCLAAGVVAVPVPLPWDESSRRRVLAVARDAGTSLVLSVSEVHEFLTAMAPDLAPVRDSYEWLLVDQVAAGSEGLAGRAGSGPAPDPDGAGVAFLQYTSGSTGSPKGVEVTYANLVHNEEAIRAAFRVTPESTIVSWLPLNHDMGLIGGLLQPLYTGARAIISDPSNFVRNPVSWLQTISGKRNVISGGPNFAYDLCVRKVTPQQLADLDLSGWTVAFNGAAQVFPSTLRRFTEMFGPVGFRPSAHLACYGLAESTLLVAATAPDTPPPTREFSVSGLDSGAAAPPGPDGNSRELVGYPLPDHATVRVVDPDTLESRDDGVLGEIVVAGPSNARGYWKNPQATEATFGLKLADGDRGGDHGYLRTGDLGFLHDGMLFVSGRSKDLMVYRGRNLHPEDLEADVATCDGHLRPGCGAVVSVPTDGDEAIVVCQEVRKDTAPERYPELSLAIRRALTRAHGVTAHTVLLVPPGTLPKTTSGKLQRHRIRELFIAGQLPALHRDVHDPDPDDTGQAGAVTGPASPGALPTSHDELATLIAEQVRQLLNLPERPHGTRSLAELGADSLHALQVQHTIEQRLGVEIPPSLLLGATSIDDLARAALAAGPGTPAAEVADRPPAAYRLNSAQQALWFLQQTAPDSFDYNVTRVFRWHGDLDPARFGDALRELAKAHPSLRLNVDTVDGRPEARLRADDAAVDCELVDASHWSDAELRRWHHGFATRPFDLARDPLLRVAVLRRDGHHLLALGLHHIVCDLSSVAVLVADLAQLYAGDAVAPCEVTPWYAAERELAVLEQRGDALAEYWRRALPSDLPAISLPWNPQERGTGEALRFRIDPEVTEALTRFARSRRLTPHNLLLAVFQVLLHRLTGQTDLLVGVPASTRDHRLRTWIGYLVNVVPVRSTFDPGEPFSRFAERTQREVLAALDHKDLAFADILRHVGVNRDAPDSTPVQAMFSYYASTLPGVDETAARIVMGDPDARLDAGPATVQAESFPEYTTQSDICLNVAPHGDGLAFEIQYAPDRVSLDQARLLGTLYPTLLESVAADGDAVTGGLAWLRPDEQQAVITASRGPDLPRPGDYLDTFQAVADRFPDREAISDPRTRLSYSELDQRSNHVAAVLSARGVGPERGVVVCAERSVDVAVALLGIHKSDGCYIPIPPSEAPRRMAAMVAAGAPVLVLADAYGRPVITEALRATGQAGVPVLDLAEVCAGSSPERPARLRPDEGAAYILFTSGSSGQPKPVVCANAAVTNHIWQMVEHLGIEPEDRVGQVSPISVDLTVWQLMSPLMVGGRSHVVPDPEALSADGLLAGLRAGVTMMELVPTDIVALLDAGLADDPGALRAMLATGDAMPPDLPRRWRREMPAVPLYNAYGSTECTDDVSIGLSAWGPDRPATLSIGRPLANTSMYIVDRQLRPVPQGAPGYLYVGGRGVSRGYHGDPRRTALAFVPDPYSSRPGARLYRTGDLVRALPTGEVEFCGRVDNQVNLRGLRVEPGEIEAALRECEQVADAAVKLERGPASDILVGYLVMADASPATTDDKGVVLGSAEDFPIRAALAEALPRHMIPSIFVRLPRLPRTSTLKVDYRALSFKPATGPAQPADQAADSPLAAEIRAAWTEQLGVPVTGPEDNFFYLGGHSLTAFALTSRLERDLGARLDVGLIFRHPRFGEFVKAVEIASGPARTRTTPDAGPEDGGGGPVPASSAQERFWFLRELAPDSAAYNMPGVLRLVGELDEARLERAIRRVLNGHPVLLARFSDHQGTLTWTSTPVDDFELSRSDLRGAVAEFGEEAFDLVVEQHTATPADLRGGFPLRAHLVRVADREWRLIMVVDHIVSDGWSMSVFLNDLADHYNTDTPSSRHGGYRFADYCREERRDRPTVEELAPLWAGVGQGGVRLSPLPVPDSGPTGRRSGQVAVEFPAAVTQSLRTLASTTGTTPFMVLAAGLAALIHSGSDQREEVLFGTLIAHRDRPEWRELVGPLLNVSLVAVDLSTSDTGRCLLDRVRESVLRCYRSSRLPFQDLVRMLPAVDDGTGSPFAVMLNLLPPPEPPPQFDGLESELRELEPTEAPYQLTIDIDASGDSWHASCRYLADLHDRDPVSQLLDRFVHVVAALVARPDAPLAELLNDLTVGGGNRG